MTKNIEMTKMVCNELERLYGGPEAINAIVSHWPIELMALTVLDAVNTFMIGQGLSAEFTAIVIKKSLDDALVEMTKGMVRH